MTTCGNPRFWQDDVADIKVAVEAMVPAGGVNQIDSYRATAAGTISAGAYSLAFVNSGASNATVNGQILGAGYGVAYEHIPGNTYPEIAFDATGTTLMIEVVRASA